MEVGVRGSCVCVRVSIRRMLEISPEVFNVLVENQCAVMLVDEFEGVSFFWLPFETALQN